MEAPKKDGDEGEEMTIKESAQVDDDELESPPTKKMKIVPSRDTPVEVQNDKVQQASGSVEVSAVASDDVDGGVKVDELTKTCANQTASTITVAVNSSGCKSPSCSYCKKTVSIPPRWNWSSAGAPAEPQPGSSKQMNSAPPAEPRPGSSKQCTLTQLYSNSNSDRQGQGSGKNASEQPEADSPEISEYEASQALAILPYIPSDILPEGHGVGLCGPPNGLLPCGPCCKKVIDRNLNILNFKVYCLKQTELVMQVINMVLDQETMDEEAQQQP